MKPIIGITMGDAAGIGPEIIVKAAASPKVNQLCRPLVIGDAASLQRAVDEAGLASALAVQEVVNVEQAVFQAGTLACLHMALLPQPVPYGLISADAGRAAYAFLARAVELAKLRHIDAICTAPLNKEALHLGGHLFPGHTEILAELTGTVDYSMMLTTPQLKVIHLTTHVGLRQAIEQITPERTYKVIRMADEMLRRSGIPQPRIAVCGINPHAGENGLFGDHEEQHKLLPAIKQAREEDINVSGPYPADTVFLTAMRGAYDIVVACYHDQGHIPVKMLGIEQGVNVTVGLKGGIIRTSVDHGTAFDIAGRQVADERSMIAAIQAAVALAPKA
ncbi:4-hydroxythreonine-4-phosphate dehydrogenase PdxA [Paenibacillus sp. J5C_2022]|uniref:4-hydroxythreonine-4-phosphate dehydrogenase PdxA n=1 Tax=Paenibacillus sp. J5C2022 TaxID=2977129 RepID=UPI0021D09800|nr:4-hydroxythreonine-4-phosphate dehydrogenase PdxA [Paenibacillus sp. J5C2022]MCU6712908.1 4-hydroxythreonine-4-phosphate dehydrogenase PdxA [Paenibacillus sp. J5C2022]